MKFLRWLLWRGVFLSLGYMAFFAGSQGAMNILTFLVCVMAAFCPFLFLPGVVEGHAKKPASQLQNILFALSTCESLAFMAAFAWQGWFGMATAVLFTICAGICYKVRVEDRRGKLLKASEVG